MGNTKLNTLFDFMTPHNRINMLDGIAGYEAGGFVGYEHGGLHDDFGQGSGTNVDYSGEPGFGGQDRNPFTTYGSNISPASLGVGGMSQGMLQNIAMYGGGDTLAGGLNNMNFTTTNTGNTTTNTGTSTGGAPQSLLDSILSSRGIQLTDEQMALMRDYDRSGVQQAAKGLSGGLLGMTQQMQQSQAGSGFAGATGASQYRAGQTSGQAQQSLADTTKQSIFDYKSQVLGDVADLVAGGADIAQGGAPTSNPDWNPPQDARSYNFEGFDWYNAEGTWLSKDDVMEKIKEQAPPNPGSGSNDAYYNAIFNAIYG